MFLVLSSKPLIADLIAWWRMTDVFISWFGSQCCVFHCMW